MTSWGCGISKSWSVIMIAGVFVLTGALISFPLRTIVADYLHKSALGNLDDRSTEYFDSIVINPDTMPDYYDAINTLKRAQAYAPLIPLYHKAVSDIYAGLGRWAEVMNYLDARLPANAIPAETAYKEAIYHMRRAIALEPTSPEYHFAAGRLYDITGEPGLAEMEFSRAVDAWPVNSNLRYLISRQHLLSGRGGYALEQARALAEMDDSYLVPVDIRGTPAEEAWVQGNLARMYKSFLFGALEIAWRVSTDPEVVRGIAPDNPDARRVLDLFFDWRGIEE